jgi:hypothetical protein
MTSHPSRRSAGPRHEGVPPQTALSDRQKLGRVLLLSDFFRGLGEADEAMLRRTMRRILDSDDGIPDRTLILRSIDDTWPEAARPAAAQRVADFYLERPDIADRPGAYGA